MTGAPLKAVPPMNAPRVKYGTLVEFKGGRQHVVTDDGDHEWLTFGWDAATGAKIGDRIKLEYRATPHLALWYGTVVKAVPPQ